MTMTVIEKQIQYLENKKKTNKGLNYKEEMRLRSLQDKWVEAESYFLGNYCKNCH